MIDVIIISSTLEENMVEKNLYMPKINGTKQGFLETVNLFVPKNEFNINLNTKLLNGIYLKDFLKKRNISSEIINTFDYEKERLKNLIGENPNAIIALSTSLLLKVGSIKKIVTYIKSIDPKSIIVLGGHFILNLFPLQYPLEKSKCKNLLKEYDLDRDVDFVIRHYDGELTLFNIVHNIKNNLPTNKMPSTACKENDFVFNSYEDENNGFENNSIRWHDFDEQFIGSNVFFMTSKGCPFKCKFCFYWKLGGNKLRYKSLESVNEEFTYLSRLKKVKSIRFVDDTFSLPVKRFINICKLMIDGGFSWKWSCFARASNLNEESVKLMKDAGCDSVFLGLESGSNKMLKLMDKRLTVEEGRKAIALLKKYNILSYGYFMCGYPGESTETVNETINFINTSGLDAFQIYRFNFLPLMTVYEERESNGLQGNNLHWKHNTMDSEVALRELGRIIDETNPGLFIPGGSEVFRPLLNYGFTGKDILSISKNIHLLRDDDKDYDLNVDNNVHINNINKRVKTVLKSRPTSAF